MNIIQEKQDAQTILTIRIKNDVNYIEAVLACMSSVAKRFNIPRKERNKLEIATEEAIMNVIQYAYDPKEQAYIDIRIETEGINFIISIRDKGKPFDFLSLDANDENLSGLGVKMMQSLTDKLEFRNLGSEGREQRLIKHLVSLPKYEQRVQENDQTLPQDLPFDIHELKEEEAIEVAQCIYDEFGYTYTSELIYYPQQFYEACQRGEVYSLVATTPDGEVAGHLALITLKDFPGIAEMAIGVVKHKYRKNSIMNKLVDIIIEKAQNHLKFNALLTQPVAYHTITQKLSNQYGLEACGFALQYTNDEFSPSKKSKSRSSIACAFRPFVFTSVDLYLPDEVKELVSDICSKMNIDRNFPLGKCPSVEDKTEATLSINQRIRLGKYYIEKAGSDIQEEIKRSMITFKKEKCAVIELYLNVQNPAAPYAYEELKKHQFFCTGFFPLSNRGEYLLMECLMSEVVDYDALTTIEPFTTLLNRIRHLDPNED